MAYDLDHGIGDHLDSVDDPVHDGPIAVLNVGPVEIEEDQGVFFEYSISKFLGDPLLSLDETDRRTRICPKGLPLFVFDLDTCLNTAVSAELPQPDLRNIECVC